MDRRDSLPADPTRDLIAVIVQNEMRLTGRVQGVGLRYRLKQLAEGRGIMGEVQNIGNNGIRAILCGDEQQVQELIEECQHMQGVEIEKVRITPQPVRQWKGFSIVH